MLDRLGKSLQEAALNQMVETKVFRRKGFDVVSLDRKDNLRPIPKNPAVICMDDREPEVGIKLPGGVTFEAAFRTGGNESGIGDAIYENRFKRGYNPTAHGDDQHGARGCAFNRAWAEGRLEGALPLYVSLDDLGRTVRKNDGRYDTLTGAHNAHMLVLNTVGNMTTRPGLLAIDCKFMRDIAGRKYEQALGAVADVVTGLKINQVGIIR